MQQLAEFLLARIAEDEALARSVVEAGDEAVGFSDAAWAVANLPEPACSHALRWAPVPVLAECEAKRRIVEEHREQVEVGEGPDYVGGVLDGLESAIRALAAVHADHPDYREEWRP